MSSPRRRKAVSSLRALGRKVPLGALPQLQPMVLLQALCGVSQTLNLSAAHLEALARGLILDGQQRLRRLRDAAPHLHLPLEHLLEMTRSRDGNREALSDEESAVQAMLEMCLGLMLQWLLKRNCRWHLAISYFARKLLLPFDALRSPQCSPVPVPLRARACPISTAQ